MDQSDTTEQSTNGVHYSDHDGACTVDGESQYLTMMRDRLTSSRAALDQARATITTARRTIATKEAERKAVQELVDAESERHKAEVERLTHDKRKIARAIDKARASLKEAVAAERAAGQVVKVTADQLAAELGEKSVRSAKATS